MTAPSPRATPLPCDELLKHMALLDNELEIEPGGSDETRAIRALNLATRYLDTVAATMASVLQQPGDYFQTDTNQSIAPPPDLLRIDSMWRLAPVTLAPVAELTDIEQVGLAVATLPWSALTAPSPGAPYGFAWKGDVIWWDRPPDQVYPIQIYGLYRTARFKDRTSTFSRPDECAFAVASFANHLIHLGDGDADQDLIALSASIYRPLLRSLSPTTRTAPRGRAYTTVHTT